MSIDIYEELLNATTCVDCVEQNCVKDGCEKLFAISDCSKIINTITPDGDATLNGFITPDQNVIDPAAWCQVNKLKGVTLNPNQTFHENFYLGECIPDDEPGRSKPTIDVDINFCDTDEGHCLLETNSVDGCLISFFCMEDRSKFVPNVSPDTLPDVMMGLARVTAPTRSWIADQQDNRVYTLRIVKRFWRLNVCANSSALRQIAATGPAVKKNLIQSDKAA